MEKRLSSSGISSNISRTTCKIKRLIQNIKGESSSCQCSMTSIGQRREIQKYVFRIPNKSRTTQEGSRVNTGRRKWYGTHTYKPEGKWNSTAEKIVEHFKETGHPVFRGISALNRGILKRKGGRCAIHFSFAQFTQKVSSVSTKQWRLGVKIWLSVFLVKTS